MDITFCDSKRCKLCFEMNRRNHLKSKQGTNERLNKILESYKKKYEGISLQSTINFDTTDDEYQEWKDNELSLGGL